MKLSEARDFYYFYTGKTSEIVRQLALAGIAVIWIFKTGQVQLPAELILPLILIALTLVLDLFQYFVAATTWGIYSRWQEKNCESEKVFEKKLILPSYTRLRGGSRKPLGAEKAVDSSAFVFHAPRAINWPGIVFFYSKSLSLIFAYWFLFEYLYPRILK